MRAWLSMKDFERSFMGTSLSRVSSGSRVKTSGRPILAKSFKWSRSTHSFSPKCLAQVGHILNLDGYLCLASGSSNISATKRGQQLFAEKKYGLPKLDWKECHQNSKSTHCAISTKAVSLPNRLQPTKIWVSSGCLSRNSLILRA